MSDLTDLYQEIILDHNKRPRNYHSMDASTHHADGHNPLCGDEVTIFVKLDGDTIADISFQGEGCAISKASASIMTSEIKGKTIKEASDKFDFVKEMLSGPDAVEPDLAEVGNLASLAGVRRFPARIKCATLAWHTLEAAIKGQASVTTE